MSAAEVPSLPLLVIITIGLIVSIIVIVRKVIKHHKKMKLCTNAEPSHWVDHDRDRKYHRDMRNLSVFTSLMAVIFLVLIWGSYLENI